MVKKGFKTISGLIFLFLFSVIFLPVFASSKDVERNVPGPGHRPSISPSPTKTIEPVSSGTLKELRENLKVSITNESSRYDTENPNRYYVHCVVRFENKTGRNLKFYRRYFLVLDSRGKTHEMRIHHYENRSGSSSSSPAGFSMKGKIEQNKQGVSTSSQRTTRYDSSVTIYQNAGKNVELSCQVPLEGKPVRIIVKYRDAALASVPLN